MIQTTTPLFIISGPSGAGKTTHVTRLLQEFPELHRIITYTTRTPRPGEVDGVDYVFVSNDAFDELVAQEKFIEVNQYGPQRYGTHVELFKRLQNGQPCVVIPDINGAIKIVAAVPSAITIWLEAPREVLEKRLTGRGTEEKSAIATRLAIALEEIEKAHASGLYQHVIDTSDGQAAYEKIKKIVAELL